MTLLGVAGAVAVPVPTRGCFCEVTGAGPEGGLTRELIEPIDEVNGAFTCEPSGKLFGDCGC